MVSSGRFTISLQYHYCPAFRKRTTRRIVTLTSISVIITTAKNFIPADNKLFIVLEFLCNSTRFKNFVKSFNEIEKKVRKKAKNEC